MKRFSEIWPHQITIPKLNSAKVVEVEIWLEENMGRISDRWYVGSYRLSSAEYYFKYEQDAVWFALRWS